MKNHFSLIILILFINPKVYSAEVPLKMDILQVENRFLQKNLSLLSAKYNIDIAKALVQQSKLWENPTILIEQNIYNQYTHKVLDMSSEGQSALQIQQMILLAGKRNKRIQLQQISTKFAEYQFFDLFRTLRLELTTNFYSLYFTQKKLDALMKQIEPLRSLTKAYEEQLLKGNVSLREVSRLRALLFNLESQRIKLNTEALGYNASLKTMLVITGDTSVVAEYNDTNADWIIEKKQAELLEEAKINRYDLLAYENDINYQQANYSLQKANAVPNMTVGGLYDRAGSYIYNYYALTLGFSLPVFNRNQHSIKAAKMQIAQSKLNYQNFALSIDNEVAYAHEKALEIHTTASAYSNSILESTEQLQKAMFQNYQKHNITLMEFVDYYESYTNNTIAFLDLKLEREKALEELNYVVGKKLSK
ncbi:MAG: TolC family protein [Opitutaceae bacterium]|nr:TolC family protein [Cytophagales bacterium]